MMQVLSSFEDLMTLYNAHWFKPGSFAGHWIYMKIYTLNPEIE